MKLILVCGHFMLKGTQSRASKFNLSPFQANLKLAQSQKNKPKIAHLVDHKKTWNSDMHIDNQFPTVSSNDSIELQLKKSFHYQSYYDPFSNEQYLGFLKIRFHRIFAAFLPLIMVIQVHLKVIWGHLWIEFRWPCL